MNLRSSAVFTASSVLILAGCRGEAAPDSGSASTSGAATNVTWILSESPADAQGVAAAKLAAVEGETVALRGKIGGRKDPLSAESAIFVMMDSAIPSCADNPGDMCKTPWDYCCETPETITANNASVMLVDGEGKTLTVDLAEHGFAELDEVVVVGTVRPRPSESVFAISATGIYRVGG